jgi:hypothetical protein
MIINSVEEFIGLLKGGWKERKISVAKTESMPDIKMYINDARLLPWHEVNKRIRCRYPEGGDFLLIEGNDAPGGGPEKSAVRSLIIRVDGGTVFDVRKSRLVLISDEEVVQLREIE